MVRVWLVCFQDVDTMQKRQNKEKKNLRSATSTLLHWFGCSSVKQDSYCREDYKPIRATELKHATRYSGTF